MITISNERTRSRKCHFLRQFLLLYISPAVMVTSYVAHIRSRKCHFLKRPVLLQLTPILKVTRTFFSSFFFFTECILLPLFSPWYFKKKPKLVLFMLYQGVLGLQHTVKSAFQPLIFIHVIDIRCYETDDADCYAYCFHQLRCLWKSRENKKILHWYRLQNMRQ